MSGPNIFEPAERERIADWLEFEAETAEGRAEQIAKLPSGASPIMRMMADRDRAYAAACRLVARHQRGYEEQVL